MLNEQQKLIKTADELRAAAGFPVSLKGEALPSLFVLSDERRLTNPLKVSENLTNSCGIILRHYHVPDRDRIAKDLLKISLEKGLTFLVAGDTNLATKIGADGIHLPENMIEGFNRPKNLRIVTAAVHSKTAITKAINAGVDAVLLSPSRPFGGKPCSEFSLCSKLFFRPVAPWGESIFGFPTFFDFLFPTSCARIYKDL